MNTLLSDKRMAEVAEGERPWLASAAPLAAEILRLRADNAALKQGLAEALSELEAARPEPIGYVRACTTHGLTYMAPTTALTTAAAAAAYPGLPGNWQVVALVPVEAP